METRSPEKRKMSTRLKHEEPQPDANAVAKKTKVRKIHARKSASSFTNPGDPGTPHSHGSSSPAPFSSKLGKDSPLPMLTASEAQATDEKNLQSIAESGVLASSLSRSRSRWITPGIFERYWTKPRTTKGVVQEPPNNPTKDTMQKLGRCRVIIEPHVFDATLYTIREPKVATTAPKPLPGQAGNVKPTITQPYSQPTNPPSQASTPQPLPVQTPQTSGPTAVQLQAQAPTPLPAKASPAQPAPIEQPASQAPLPQAPSTPIPAATTEQPPVKPTQPPTHSPAPPQTLNITSQQPAPTQTQVQQPPPSTPVHQPLGQPTHVPLTQSPKPSAVTAPLSAQQPASAPPRQAQVPLPPIPKSVPGQDPVILMLAQRASSDPDLKVLMKIVASGQASKEQLAVFQGHIDELQAILTRHNQARVAQPAQMQQRPGQPGQSFQNRPPSYQQPYPSAKPMTFAYDPTHHTQPKFKTQPPLRLDMTGACMEFDASSTAERLLFPKQSIVEYTPGALSARVSFLVVRRGDGTASDFEVGKSYYQPVTMLVTADNTRIVEPLTRAVAAPDTVRAHMTETMSKAQRAPQADLVLRLPAPAEDDDAPPTAAALDRRANLKSLPASMLTPTGRRKKHAALDDLDACCRFCFESVLGANGQPAAAAGEIDVQPVCRTCAALRARNSDGSGYNAPIRRVLPVRNVSGPQALLFAA